MVTGERAEDAAAEIMKMVGRSGYLITQAVAEIIQKAIDDDFDDRMQDAEGS